MFLFLFSQILFKAESVEIYISDLGKLKGIQSSYISKDKYKIYRNFNLEREENVSKLIEKYYAGRKTTIIDLKADSIYKIDDDEKTFFSSPLKNYLAQSEKLPEEKKEKAKFSLKNLGNCYYEIKIELENEYLLAHICYKEIQVEDLESAFLVNYNKKLQLSDINEKLLSKIGMFSFDQPFIKILISGIVKKNDIEKISKIKGYPVEMDIKIYQDTLIIYSYKSKIFSMEDSNNEKAFVIDSSYKHK